VKSLNQITIIGNVGRDPETRTTAGGQKVARLSVATSEKWATGERTYWHRVTVWGKLADVVEQYVKKGDRIYVQGRMEYDTYEKDGQNIPTAEINARDLIMLGGGNGSQDTPAPSDAELARPSDDPPF